VVLKAKRDSQNDIRSKSPMTSKLPIMSYDNSYNDNYLKERLRQINIKNSAKITDDLIRTSS